MTLEELKVHILNVRKESGGKRGANLAREIYHKTTGSVGDIIYFIESEEVYQFCVEASEKMYTVTIKGERCFVEEHITQSESVRN